MGIPSSISIQTLILRLVYLWFYGNKITKERQREEEKPKLNGRLSKAGSDAWKYNLLNIVAPLSISRNLQVIKRHFHKLQQH